MTAPDPKRTTRVRPSSKAIDLVLTALSRHGLPVDNIRITGAQIDISFGGVAVIPSPTDDGGLKEW